jgi:Flp pilus assembly protein TadG
MVTAEFAVALPALVLAAATAVGGVVAMTDELKCADAAATAARMAARGDSTAMVRSVAMRAAPRGATLVLTTSDGAVTATVTDRLGGFGGLPSLTLRQRSVAAAERGVASEPR